LSIKFLGLICDSNVHPILENFSSQLFKIYNKGTRKIINWMLINFSLASILKTAFDLSVLIKWPPAMFSFSLMKVWNKQEKKKFVSSENYKKTSGYYYLWKLLKHSNKLGWLSMEKQGILTHTYWRRFEKQCWGFWCMISKGFFFEYLRYL
jgi:hypothetical protein